MTFLLQAEKDTDPTTGLGPMDPTRACRPCPRGENSWATQIGGDELMATDSSLDILVSIFVPGDLSAPVFRPGAVLLLLILAVIPGNPYTTHKTAIEKKKTD